MRGDRKGKKCKKKKQGGGVGKEQEERKQLYKGQFLKDDPQPGEQLRFIPCVYLFVCLFTSAFQHFTMSTKYSTNFQEKIN